ncbi:phosphogluconate dehydrogenase (decarboxylating), NAD binding domain containing protein [Acanthamoeba castellanii str. Neff]|uniref:Phosphogluconate dehydrogenase (Decarboxylating), NAD binding domain containing protein n=1 Tax=Acanthamoeba castellanii (strain ATCC 30010 / Neff) TaxID=1257118 RepID=L8GKQ5_ACACF|nr:phosphogluconate dehydrogenase (decarboxylating), NAD binding domain containing protein [Acanthamoeba castellanii str. Neff]ELR13318.1 phosphogluconate dehydrogenase (decarboxylating), NAD binding domain containing protein [Acanthamoeba castellanii str. Neff]
MTLRVAFLGVGAMGYPMAEHLLKKGHQVWVWNRTKDKALPLQEAGAVVVDRVEEAVAAADVVVAMLFDAGAVQATILDSGPVREALRGRTLVNCATVAPADNQRFQRDVLALGASFVEAPVLGATPVAQQGALQVLVGSTAEQFEQLKDMFAAFGTPRHISEDIGRATTLKLALNQIVLGEIVTFANSLAMVKNAGLSEEALMEVLRPSQLYSKYFDLKMPTMVSRDFSSVVFDIAGAKKDSELISAEAARLGVNTVAVESLREVYTRAAEDNPGADYVAVYNTINPPQQQ